MRRYVAVVAAVLATITGVAVLNNGGSGQTARLFVNTSGCTTNPTRPVANTTFANAAASSIACSLDQANDVCQNGDLVLVKGGNYGAQNVTGWNNRTLGGGDCTISEASGETVVLQELKSGNASGTDGPRALTYEGFRVVAASGQEDSVQLWGDCDGITLRDIDAGNWYIERCRNVTVDGGDWGPCFVWHAGGGSQGGDCTNDKIVNTSFATNITVQDGLYHDYRCDKSSGDWDCHFECMKLDSGQNVTIKRNVFKNCAFYNIFADNFGVSFAGLDINSNQFDTPWNEAFPTPSQARQTGVELAGKGGTISDVKLRFNSFHGSTGLSLNTGTFSNIRVTGNLFGINGSCSVSGATFRYNVYDDASTCNGIGEVALNTSFPYINNSMGSNGNYRLTGTATSIDNLVPTSVTDGCPATDIDGDTRPANINCDSGMDERG